MFFMDILGKSSRYSYKIIIFTARNKKYQKFIMIMNLEEHYL